MKFSRKVFVPQVATPAVLAALLGVLAAGCSSTSAPPPAPPPPTTAPPPASTRVFPPPVVPSQAALPQPSLSSADMAKLCQAAPETCRRVQMTQPLSLDDVKVMAKLSFSPDIIIAQVRNSHTVYHLTASSIIDLKNFGVSDQVIDFLLSTPSSIAGTTPVPEPQLDSPAAQTPPPPAPVETPPPAPSADYVWVDGDWVWNGGWVWVGGHWVYPPYPGAVWFHGGWGRGWGGFRRTRGHWR
jgi:hypothetical protein